MKELLGLTRYVVLLGVGGSLVASAILFLSGFLQIGMMGGLARQAVGDPKGLKLLAIEAIHLADYFLIATALYIVAVGLYELFIGEVKMPDRLSWLKVRSLDELKDRLIGVVVTVLAVTFLGIAAEWTEGEAVLSFGLALAAIIVALGIFGWLTYGSKGIR
jgi:uncharacterized membrane protein YqhA